MNYEQTSCENSSISTSSRRDFLKIAGAAVCAAAGAATLGGCAPKLPQSGAEASTALSSEVAWDEETDVLVVGSGMAGLASAVTVATEGEGATCLLLEKGTSPLGGRQQPVLLGLCAMDRRSREFPQLHERASRRL